MRPDPVRLTIQLQAGENPPSEFRIFAAGSFETTKGVFVFDDKAAASVMSAAADWGNEFPVDYDHAMLGFLMVDPAESAKAAGWFTPALRDGELWATNVSWTPRGAQKLQDREFRYISPAFNRSEDGHVTELVNVALTNLPATKHQNPLVAHRGEESKEPTMWKTLLALLSVAENATEDQAVAAVKTMLGRESELLSALDADTHDKALATVAGLKAKAEAADKAVAELAKIQAEQVTAKRTALLDEAAKDGRLTPAKRAELLAAEGPLAWSRDVTALETCLSLLPKPAPEPREPKAPASASLTSEEEEVAKQMGISPEALKASKK